MLNLTTSQWTKLALGVAACLVVVKFVPNAQVKAAALGVAGVIVAKRLPYVGDALA